MVVKRGLMTDAEAYQGTDPFAAGHRGGDLGHEVELGLGLGVLDAGAGGGVARQEQRAAVVEGQDRGLVGPDAAGERGGLDLVVGERAAARAAGGGSMTARFSIGLARDLAQVLAGDERRRAERSATASAMRIIMRR